MMRHAEEDTFYHPSTSRKRTFVRQLVVDSIIFAQNITMIVLAKDTVTSTVKFRYSYMVIVIVAGICYSFSMLLKLVFYTQCHPWAKIIKPRPSSSFETSTVICSRLYDVKIKNFSISFVKTASAQKHSCNEPNDQITLKNPETYFSSEEIEL